MVLEIATILLGAGVGAVAVLYAAPKGYLGHRKTKSRVTSIDSYAAKTEQAKVPAADAPTAAAPASSAKSAPAPYERVQPSPAPVTYAAPSTVTFGAPSLAKKPTRTYRRRTAPVRSGTAAKKPGQKSKKR